MLGPRTCRYGECKTAVVQEAEPEPQGDEGVAGRAHTVSSAASQQFDPLLATLTRWAGHHSARELFFLADRQAYNWMIAASQFRTAL